MAQKTNPTARFDFVTDDVLRQSLESDYREICTGIEGKAWKSVHVLAGSVVEALLIDWLGANGVTPRGKDLLRIDLPEAIELCKTSNLISTRSADLTSVVKDYRNLIHPGRIIRTNDKVDRQGAEVAKALVGMIAQDIATMKAEKYGYTAEQIVRKIVNDPACVSYIGHLLKDTKDNEKERLLLKAIPNEYVEIATVGMMADPDTTGRVMEGLRRCFRLLFTQSDDARKRKAVARYVEILKKDGDLDRLTYEEAFFLASDISYCRSEDRSLILDHLLSRLEDAPCGCPKMYEGIGAFLDGTNWHRFVNALLAEILNGNNAFDYSASLLFKTEMRNMGPAVAKLVTGFLTSRHDYESRNGYEYHVYRLATILGLPEKPVQPTRTFEDDIPF